MTIAATQDFRVELLLIQLETLRKQLAQVSASPVFELTLGDNISLHIDSHIVAGEIESKIFSLQRELSLLGVTPPFLN